MGHIVLPSFIRQSVRERPFVTHFCACHIFRTLHARVSKFYIWVFNEKLADPFVFCFFCFFFFFFVFLFFCFLFFVVVFFFFVVVVVVVLFAFCFLLLFFCCCFFFFFFVRHFCTFKVMPFEKIRTNSCLQDI